ncbi:MAG: CPBP family intramembrane glutamic endopeptidase [Micropepsaceae bacterium]
MSTRRGMLWQFYVLLFMLSVPFWLLGFVVGRLPIPINLPIAALMAGLPAAIALWLSRKDGRRRLVELLGRIVDVARVRNVAWIGVAALLMPAALVVAYGLQRMAGEALPAFEVSPATLGAFLVLFVVGGIGEELGWQGFVYPLMRARWSALTSSVMLGSLWAMWHLVPFLQAERSGEWILWQNLTMLPLRIITVWLFVNAGESVCVAIIFHAMCNVAQFSFPTYGSHYEPLMSFMVLTVIVIGIVASHGETLERRQVI